MAILNIVEDTDEIIRKKSKKVEVFDERLSRLIDDMRDTLKKSGGVGLAAVQVGILKNVVLVDNGSKVLELVNPIIVEAEGEQEDLEGCLSCPGKWGITHRPMKVTVEAQDRKGKTHRYSGDGLTARCFCHEIDHLSGKLFYDEAIHMLTEEELEELGE